MPPSYARYLLVFGGSLLTVLLAAWVYVAAAPMAFMESGYAAWAAKSAMLQQCTLGQVAFFGDSRLEAGVIPAELPAPASNFGLAAGTPIETRVAVDRALTCPDLPRQAVIALVPEHFGPVSQFFWLLSVRYGFLTFGDVLATERLAAQLGDRQTFSTPTPDSLGGRARDWLYAVHFPSFSFASLVQGRGAGRLDSNRARFAEVTAARGWARYAGGERVKTEHPERFIVTALQGAELDAALSALRGRGVETFLMIMPFAPSHQETDAVLAQYQDYLAGVAQRSGARLLDDQAPIWPERLFADGAHLDADGARALSFRLAACMAGGTLRAPCDLAWHDEAASGGSSAVLEVQQQGHR